MDAFFASCEELRHSEHHGKPLIVGADPNAGRGRGVVIAANYAARALGVRTAMPIGQAWQRAPHAAYVWPEHGFYSEIGRKVFDDLGERFRIRRVSIDEAFIDVAGVDDASAFAASIHERVASSSGGLTCSVGIGPNRLIAKIASGHRKPDATTIVTRDEAQRFLDPLKVGDVPYIGPKTAGRLQALGILIVRQLRERSREELLRGFGVHGAYMHDAAHGLDHASPFDSPDGARSMSHERTFDEDTRSRGRILSSLRWMMDALEEQLGRDAYAYRTVAIKMRYADFATTTRQASLLRPSTNTAPARRLVPRILGGLMRDPRSVRLVGLRLSGLDRAPEQRTLEDFA